MKLKPLLAICLLGNCLAAMATATIDSLLTDYNHFMYNVNDKLDTHIAKPAATFYNLAMPHPLNRMIHRFYVNLNAIPAMANDLLQADFYDFDQDAWRFAINSTVGIGGLYTPANQAQLYIHNNDFGLTLAQWGWKQSRYFVVPVLGPGTIRDAFGDVGTLFMSVYPYIQNSKVSDSLFLAYLIDKRADALQYQNLMDNAALDPYTFMSNAYLQNRNYQIEQMQNNEAPYTAENTRAYMRTTYLYQ